MGNGEMEHQKCPIEYVDQIKMPEKELPQPEYKDSDIKLEKQI